MTEDNKIFKTNEFSIEISPVGKAIQAKDIQYFSYDENSGLQLIHILMDGKPLDLPNGTEILLSAVKINNQNQKLIYTPEIVDPLYGIVSFIIPREFLGYQGKIRCGLYINFPNNQTMHVGYFYINMRVSDIDANLTEFTEDFWQGWSEFEAGSTAKMQELEQRIDEQTEIFNNADVYNKAEIEEKLEPFALQTDIDTFEIKKADKTDVNQLATDKADKTALAETDAEVAELDSSKADKAALASSNDRIDGIAANKVDKGGASQVTMGMLAQDVKTAMTGGSVAVVGKDAVGTTNVVDDAITLAKVDKNVVPVSYTVRNGILPKFTKDNEAGLDQLKLSVGDTDLIRWGTKWHWIPKDTIVTASTSMIGQSMLDLLFQTKDNTFRLVSYGTARLIGELYITTIPRNGDGQLLAGNGFAYVANDIRETKTFLPQATWQAASSANPYTINYTTKKIKFNDEVSFNYGHQFISGGIARNQEIDLTEVLDTSKTSLWCMIINRLTKEVKFVEYTKTGDYRTGDWWQITLVRRKSASFVVFENDLNKNKPYSKGRVRFVNAKNGRFIVDRESASLIFRSDWADLTGVFDSGAIGNLLVNNATIPLPSTSEIGSTAMTLFFDKIDSQFKFFLYNTAAGSIDENRYEYFGSIRRTADANGKLLDFSADLPIPWELDGMLYGLYAGPNSGQSYPSIALDAPVRCIHHRGYSSKYPENTLRAYRESKKIGVNEVEMDIAWTSDLVPVSLHDTTINRTARNPDGSAIATTDLAIGSLTLEDARQYDYGIWKSPEFKGEKLPTLEEIVVQCKTLNQRLHLDRALNLNAEKLDIVAEILDRHKYHDVIWYINSQASAELIRSKYPTARLSFLIFGDVNQTAIDICKQFNVGDTECVVNAQANYITDENVALALAEGISVTVWNADLVDRKHLIEIGITGISTDSINIQQELLVD